MPPVIGTEDKDMGYGRLLRTARELAQKNPRVDVGLLVGEGAEEEHENGVPVAVAATANEFGVPGQIPERPAWRQSFDKNLKKYSRIEEIEANKVLQGRQTVFGVLTTLGQEIGGDIQEEIKQGDFAPNAPSTLARKGEDKKPLTDTGLTASLISHEVRMKGEKEFA